MCWTQTMDFVKFTIYKVLPIIIGSLTLTVRKGTIKVYFFVQFLELVFNLFWSVNITSDFFFYMYLHLHTFYVVCTTSLNTFWKMTILRKWRYFYSCNLYLYLLLLMISLYTVCCPFFSCKEWKLPFELSSP